MISFTIQKFSGTEFFGDLLPRVVALLLIVGAVIFFFILVIGAVQYITAGSDKAAVESARKRITNGLVGAVLLFSVFAIATLIENFFGIKVRLESGAVGRVKEIIETP